MEYLVISVSSILLLVSDVLKIVGSLYNISRGLKRMKFYNLLAGNHSNVTLKSSTLLIK